MDMSTMVELQTLRVMSEQKRQSMLTYMYILDDLASEILILDDPSSMREVALYMKEVIQMMEEI